MYSAYPKSLASVYTTLMADGLDQMSWPLTLSFTQHQNSISLHPSIVIGRKSHQTSCVLSGSTCSQSLAWSLVQLPMTWILAYLLGWPAFWHEVPRFSWHILAKCGDFQVPLVGLTRFPPAGQLQSRAMSAVMQVPNCT